MMEREPTVFVVGDRDVCETLRRPLTLAGLEVEDCESVERFSDAHRADRRGCVILGLPVAVDELLEIHARLSRDGVLLPVIVVTPCHDARAIVRALKAGVVDHLVSPVVEVDLLEAVHAAIALDARRSEKRAARTAFGDRLRRLTPREREVMDLVVEGLANKQIAARLGLSENTILIHRKHVMKKLRVRSAVDLVRTVLLSDPTRLESQPLGHPPR